MTSVCGRRAYRFHVQENVNFIGKSGSDWGWQHCSHVQCVNQSSETQRQHYSLGYFNAKGWAVWVYHPPLYQQAEIHTVRLIQHCGCCCFSHWGTVKINIFYIFFFIANKRNMNIDWVMELLLKKKSPMTPYCTNQLSKLKSQILRKQPQCIHIIITVSTHLLPST